MKKTKIAFAVLSLSFGCSAFASVDDMIAIDSCQTISIEYRENGNAPTSGDTEVFTDSLSLPEAQNKAKSILESHPNSQVIKSDEECRVVVSYTE